MQILYAFAFPVARLLRRPRTLVVFATLASISYWTACSGSPNNPSPPSPVAHVSIAITAPSTPVNLYATNSVQFTASVSGTSDSAVNWTVTEPQGGTVTTSGLYTAPAAAGTFHVVATSQVDGTKSATAAVTVSIPAPSFTTNPTAAAVGSGTYTYTAAVSDPAGSQVTLTLVGPVGAVLSGSVITWTPTTAQSRTSNSFVLTANTAAGGTQTQSWTVIPNGTISISDIDNYWHSGEQGGLVSTSQPNDLSDATNFPIAALVPQADGSVIRLPGVGASDGTATIANVPAGGFWLQIRPDEFYWTSSSTFDYGSDFLGQPPATPISTTLVWDIHNFVPWDPSLDGLSLYEPNTGLNFASVSLPDPGSVSLQAQEPYSGPSIETSEANPGYVLQKRHQSSGTSDVSSVISMGQTTDLELTNGGDPGTAQSSMTSLSASQSGEVAINVSAYNQLAPNVNPGFAYSSGSGQLLFQPLMPNHAVVQGGASLLDFTLFDVSGDQDLGQFAYGNLFPTSWAPVFSYSQGGSFSSSIPASGGATVDISAVVSHVTPIVPSTGQMDMPSMSPVQNPQINGVSLFATTSLSGPPTISWTPPTGLVPAGYSIAIDPIAKDGSGYYVSDGIELYTATTSIAVPPGLMSSGQMYVITITAVADARANFASSPWRSAYPMAWADAISGVISYTDTTSSAVGTAIARASRVRASAAPSTSATASTRPVAPNFTDLTYRRSHAQRAMAMRSAQVRRQASAAGTKQR